MDNEFRLEKRKQVTKWPKRELFELTLNRTEFCIIAIIAISTKDHGKPSKHRFTDILGKQSIVFTENHITSIRKMKR